MIRPVSLAVACAGTLLILIAGSVSEGASLASPLFENQLQAVSAHRGPYPPAWIVPEHRSSDSSVVFRNMSMSPPRFFPFRPPRPPRPPLITRLVARVYAAARVLELLPLVPRYRSQDLPNPTSHPSGSTNLGMNRDDPC